MVHKKHRHHHHYSRSQSPSASRADRLREELSRLHLLYGQKSVLLVNGEEALANIEAEALNAHQRAIVEQEQVIRQMYHIWQHHQMARLHQYHQAIAQYQSKTTAILMFICALLGLTFFAHITTHVRELQRMRDTSTEQERHLQQRWWYESRHLDQLRSRVAPPPTLALQHAREQVRAMHNDLYTRQIHAGVRHY